jgi:hypothetical protein
VLPAAPPSGRFRGSASLLANGDPERRRAGLEDTAATARRVGALFRGVDLDLILKTDHRAVRADDQGGCCQPAVDETLRSQNNVEVGSGGCPGNGGPGMLEELGIGRRNRLPIPR